MIVQIGLAVVLLAGGYFLSKNSVKKRVKVKVPVKK